jgi:predicted secreted protein
MRTWKKQLAVTVASVSCLLGQIAAAEPVAKEVSPQVLSVPAKAKQLVVRLQSNRTSGYNWFLSKYDARLLKPVSYHYELPAVGMMGAPGSSVWTFQVLPAAQLVPGMTTIRWTYSRPWEKADHAKVHLTTVYFSK